MWTRSVGRSIGGQRRTAFLRPVHSALEILDARDPRIIHKQLSLVAGYLKMRHSCLSSLQRLDAIFAGDSHRLSSLSALILLL
jgi:hypothetical protein